MSTDEERLLDALRRRSIPSGWVTVPVPLRYLAMVVDPDFDEERVAYDLAYPFDGLRVQRDEIRSMMRWNREIKAKAIAHLERGDVAAALEELNR